MANAGVAKGSTVEVSSEDPGFHGAWYVATLLDEHTYSSNKKSSNKKTNKKTANEIGYLVKYDTLLKDDSLDEPLTEIVAPSCVRPLPPRNLRRNNVKHATSEGGGGDDFELYDVVDAYHREGWWIGVVNKVITVAGTRKYVVSFENPPEEVEFGRSQLRLHVDWVDGKWEFPPKKTPEDKSAERNAKRASEPDNDARAGLTTPSKGARTTDVDGSTAGPQPSPVTKTRSRKTTEKSSEIVVGAVKDSDSSKRNKGSKGNTKVKSSVMEKHGSDDVQEDSPIMEPEMNKSTRTPDVDNTTVAPQPSSTKKSRAKKNSEKSSEMVGVVKASDPPAGNKGNTKEKASVTEKSKSDAVNQDQPLTESETNKNTTTPDVDISTVVPQPSSAMKSRARKNSERSSETAGVVKASDPSPGSKGSTKSKESKSDGVHQDSPLIELETNKTTTETCAEDSQSPQKKRKVKPAKLPAKEPISLQQGGHEGIIDLDEPLSQLPGLKKSFSSRPNHNDDPPSQPTATNPGPDPDHNDEPPSQPTVTSPEPGPDHHNEPVRTTTDYQQNWPFTKRSPIWDTIASLEFYQTPQQRPHFTPLKKIKADHREGLAIAHVVTFGNLVQMLSTLQLTDPVDVIHNSLEILTDLETHGFDVGAIRGRLNKFLSLKSKASQHTIKLKNIEEEFEKCVGERCVEEKEINEVEMKIKELQVKLAQRLAMKKVRDEEMMGLQSNMKLASEQISDCELAFKKLASTPLL